MTRTVSLQVAIPHFFREGAGHDSEGYGSGRSGNRLARCAALSRCLGSVLALNRAPQDWLLNLAEQHVERTPPSRRSGLQGVVVNLHLFVCGEDWLHDVVDLYMPRLKLHHVELDDPRQLPLIAVRQLLDMPGNADFSMYLEDDLIIQDPFYLDKISWFYTQTENRFVLMPHRFEHTVANSPQKLYVDGPIKELGKRESVWASDEIIVATGQYLNEQEVDFANASNPHSGSFCVSKIQRECLSISSWPPPTFIGPLETAATGTLLNVYPILKSSWACREFLQIEHGNPSFLSLLNQFPRRDDR